MSLISEQQNEQASKKIKKELNKNIALAIDFGINNLATCVTNEGRAFIIDGRRLKSINQYYNKINTELQIIKAKQGINRKTAREKQLAIKRDNRIDDYMNKSARIIINYCLENDIGIIVCGYNEVFQKDLNTDNQNFINIPYEKLINRLEHLSKLNGIEFKMQEESYTSKASFFDEDKVPIYNDDNSKNCGFSGKRIKRGLYQTKNGYLLNADCNGALNILLKSNVVDLTNLYNRGKIDTPKRIRIL